MISKVGKVLRTVLAASALWSASALAGDSVNLDRWWLSANKDQCQLQIQNDEPSSFIVFGMNRYGNLEIFGRGDQWRLPRGGANIDLTFDDGANFPYEGAATTNFGANGADGAFQYDYYNQYVLRLLTQIRKSSRLDLKVAGMVIARYDLGNSAEAIDALQRCLGKSLLGRRIETEEYNRDLVAVFNKEIASDAARRWQFNRFDPGSVFSVQLIALDAGRAIHRAHYTYNGGSPGYVDMKWTKAGRCLAYWDFPNSCISVEQY